MLIHALWQQYLDLTVAAENGVGPAQRLFRHHFGQHSAQYSRGEPGAVGELRQGTDCAGESAAGSAQLCVERNRLFDSSGRRTV